MSSGKEIEVSPCYSKEYLKAVSAYVASDMKLLSYLFRKITDPSEKKLIEIRILMEKNKKDLAISMCESIKSQRLEVLGEKSFLLATLYYSKRHYETSIQAGIEALASFQQLNLSPRIFISSINIAMGYAELRLYTLSFYYLNLAKNHMADLGEQLLLYRYMACLYSQKNDYQQAKKYLKLIEDQSVNWKSFDKESFSLVAGGICAWHGDYDSALRYFDAVKRGSSLLIRERLKSYDAFIRKILIANSPLALGEVPSFFSKDSEFFYQWRLLSAVQSGDLQQVNDMWQKLRSIRPQYYLSDALTVPESEKYSIFAKSMSRLQVPEFVHATKSDLPGKLAKAVNLLSQSRMPLRKEELIEKIWETRYDPSFDSRFYKLIERVKQKSKFKILQKNRAYFLQS